MFSASASVAWKCDSAGLGHGAADKADDNGHGQRDNDHGGEAAAETELIVLILCCHEVQQHMGHSESSRGPMPAWTLS